jgi:hypothetical protein
LDILPEGPRENISYGLFDDKNGYLLTNLDLDSGSPAWIRINDTAGFLGKVALVLD